MGPGFRRDDVGRELAIISPGRRVERACAIISSPSLPWRDDLDLVAGFELCFGPAALRDHVVVQRDREMRALVVELAEQRVHACGIHLALLTVDDQKHWTITGI